MDGLTVKCVLLDIYFVSAHGFPFGSPTIHQSNGSYFPIHLPTSDEFDEAELFCAGENSFFGGSLLGTKSYEKLSFHARRRPRGLGQLI